MKVTMNAKLSNSKDKDQSSNLVHMWLRSHCAQQNDNYSGNKTIILSERVW